MQGFLSPQIYVKQRIEKFIENEDLYIWLFYKPSMYYS